LVSLATASPPFQLNQTDVAAVAGEMFSLRYEDFDRLSKVFTTSGIETRQAVQPIDWYRQTLGWPERTAAFIAGGETLFIEAAGKALRAAGLSGADVDTVVTVTSTGVATPSLEARVSAAMGFREDVSRVPVFGLGCAAGVSGLSIGARLAEARPGSNVLVVVIELCTLSFRLDLMTKANIVATALFGDGAAACVLRAGDGGLASIEATGEHTWPDTLDVMGWAVDPMGFGVIFAQAIPPFARTKVGPAVLGILTKAGFSMAEIDRFICHPGGRKVVSSLESALALEPGTLDHERDVLREHGNMSSPTVLFVLERVLKQGLPDLSAVLALGPGFTASCAVLRRVA